MMRYHILFALVFPAFFVLSGCTRNEEFVNLVNPTPWMQVIGMPPFYNMVKSGGFLFAGAGMILIRSSDNGMTWKQMPGLPFGQFVVADINGTLLAGDWSNRQGVFLSTDNGQSWSQRDTGLSLGPGNNRAILSFFNRGPGIFVGTEAGIYVTTDMGAHWSAANSGISQASTYCFGAVGSRLFAGTVFDAVVSADEGGHWSVADSGMTDNRVLPGRVLPVVTFAADDRRIFAGTIGGQIFRSTNYGASWVNVSNSLPLYGQSGIYLAMDGSRLFAGYDAGVYVSTDHGDTWSNWTDNLPTHVIGVIAIAGGYIFAGTNDGTVWRRPL